MAHSRAELLTTHFYDWELRGRGWLVYEQPVVLEPPFHPFFYHDVPAPPDYVDDGLHQTLLSRFAGLFKDKPRSEVEPNDTADPFEIAPLIFEDVEPLKVFSVVLPKEHPIAVEESVQLLLMLSSCQYPVSFEIIGNATRISIQFVCRESDARLLEGQIKGYFPDCVVTKKPDTLRDLVTSSGYAYLSDFGLKDEFTRPIAQIKTLDPDPLIGIMGILDTLKESECGIIQILFQGAVNPWAPSIMRSVLDNEGGSFFADAPDMVPLAKEKVTSPLFGVTMRIMGLATDEDSAFLVNQHLGSAFARIYTSPHNSLIPLSSTNYDFSTRLSDILCRTTHRLGMLLNLRELATLVHLPSASVTSLKLERDAKKTKAAHINTDNHDLVLGLNTHQGKHQAVSLSTAQRLRHIHVIGATGTGKSTFILNCIVQDINKGSGVAVLDPHGDLIESVLQYIPESRYDDVVIIDPADSEYPVAFNILTAHSEIEKDILSSDLVYAFKRLSSSWGDQMHSVFSNAILAFLESEKGGTLNNLRRFLIEKPFRDAYLKSVLDPNIIYYWQKEFPLLKTGSIAPILTRLDTFLRPKLIRNMVVQKQGLDFGEFLDSKKIVLVKLSQGLIGTENSYLLGTLIVSKIHQAAMARQAVSKDLRSEYYLYIDEFQNFITPSMSHILSGARKYGLGLILAHQDMQQLVKYDSELASSVISNPGTRVCFRLGDIDAKRLEEGFSYFDAKDLQNLSVGEAICRIDRPENDFNLSISQMPKPLGNIGEERKESIIANSREKYGTPKSEVEKLLNELREDLLGKVIVEAAQSEIPKYIPRIPAPEPVKPFIPTPVPVEILKKPEESPEKKEETQHRYLQTLIKKMAESRGYKASIEEPIPDGKGSVDVSLERNKKRIAVEICVTTTKKWEVHNIQKCFAAGYDVVIECSTETKTLDAIRKEVGTTLDESHSSRLFFFEPEALFQFLDQEIAKDASTETRVKGYRVKVEYDAVSESEMQKKRESVAKVVVDSMKKMKKK